MLCILDVRILSVNVQEKNKRGKGLINVILKVVRVFNVTVEKQ